MENAFKQLDPNKTRIVLVDPGDRVLRAMPEMLSESAFDSLKADGVEFLPKGRVQTMRPGELIIGTPDGDVRIQAATVIWTAGVRASSLGKKLSDATGCEVDRGGRVVVQPDFSIPGRPEIRVAGDLSSYSHTTNGKPLPGMAAPAKQAGTFIGKDIAAIVAGRQRPNFSYFDFGSMAVLDRASAVADLRGLKFSGGIGWLRWAFVHLVLIPGWENRITLSVKWIFALLTQQRAAMLLTGMPSQHLALDALDAHFPMQAGEGPSIAEPDAALKAAMDYYSHQVMGHPQEEELVDTREGSAADSAAAMR
jgi:NADH dehydrogenase